ncbi:MAG: DUF1015 domain-containing protein [Thermodesulfobacteriota bacterium]
MAVVMPFRALRYDPALVPDLRRVVTPPYDVISPREQDDFYRAHPHNVIRVELNRASDRETPQDNCYTRAAAHLREWVAEGVLRRDERPAFYISETTYADSDGSPRTRRGFFTALRVEDFSAGVVLPHEKTFTGHKEDRLKLTMATGANVSPIFALYPDDANAVWSLLDAAKEPAPLADFTDPFGLPQKLHAVRDPEACRAVRELMADKVIFIADGHHRYETALNYRNHMRGRFPGRGADAAFNHVLTYLCSMSDPGLTVFPCHRVLPRRDGFDVRDFLPAAAPYFTWTEIPAGGDLAEAKARLQAVLAEAGNERPSFGLVAQDAPSFYVLSLREGVRRGEVMDVAEPELKDLDVVVLTDIVLDKILGLDNQARDQLHTIKYVSRLGEVVDEVRSGQARLAFLLNPTRVEQVQAVAEAGLIMPRKSTYFYPKVLTGLVINPLDPDEDLTGCQG